MHLTLHQSAYTILNPFATLYRKTGIMFSPLERTKPLFREFDRLRFEIGDPVTSLLEGGLTYCKLKPHG